MAGDRSLRTWKGRGLVSNVFDERFKSFIHPDDYVYIGCASGESTNHVDIPPLELESSRYKLSVSLDGFVPDKESMFNEQVMGRWLVTKLNDTNSITAVLTDTMNNFSDSYFSLVVALFDKEKERSELVVARDRYGIRPLYLGSNGDEVFVASESAPIDVLESMGQEIEEKGDVTPGSIVRVSEKGLTETKVLEPRRSHCVFEWVYFGRPDSVIECQTVHSVRKRLGRALVRTHSLKNLYNLTEGPSSDIALIPVPDSGRSVCAGVAEGLGIYRR